MAQLQLQQRVLAFLIEKAMTQTTTTYEELASRFGLATDWPQMGVQVGGVLTDIFHWCESRRMPKLTVLVVRKSGADAGLPGGGFWNLLGIDANAFGRSEKDALTRAYTQEAYRFFIPTTQAQAALGANVTGPRPIGQFVPMPRVWGLASEWSWVSEPGMRMASRDQPTSFDIRHLGMVSLAGREPTSYAHNLLLFLLENLYGPMLSTTEVMTRLGMAPEIFIQAAVIVEQWAVMSCEPSPLNLIRFTEGAELTTHNLLYRIYKENRLPGQPMKHRGSVQPTPVRLEDGDLTWVVSLVTVPTLSATGHHVPSTMMVELRPGKTDLDYLREMVAGHSQAPVNL